MASRDALWRRFVLDYDIEVPEDKIQNELEYIKLEMRHRMQYDRMSGGGLHMFPEQELAEQVDELHEAAVFEAKSDLVLKDIIAKQGISATPEELAAEGERIAREQSSTIDMVKRFFGDDFAGLERDVCERKAIDWALSQGR